MGTKPTYTRSAKPTYIRSEQVHILVGPIQENAGLVVVPQWQASAPPFLLHWHEILQHYVLLVRWQHLR